MSLIKGQLRSRVSIPLLGVDIPTSTKGRPGNSEWRVWERGSCQEMTPSKDQYAKLRLQGKQPDKLEGWRSKNKMQVAGVASDTTEHGGKIIYAGNTVC